eukprot:TRINITY_DN3329_c0_g2_i1.p1 TRINITY_DN3329_c0_g2~~TRINITY_DN3329_c0_g2_i1.p1  ORF type:complete len:151 (-),score=12.81 TRINITY_DN3329_c0_g2_i1:70-522(-)
MNTAFTLILLIALATFTPQVSAQKLFFFDYVYSHYTDASCNSLYGDQVVVQETCVSSNNQDKSVYFDESFLTTITPEWPQTVTLHVCDNSCSFCLRYNLTSDACETLVNVLGVGVSVEVSLVYNIYFYIAIGILVVLVILILMGICCCCC